ncbi:MAG TPA: TonB family protein [Terriglobales bacterium]|nr:TonB family protein [Terriglobales bacterium]
MAFRPMSRPDSVDPSGPSGTPLGGTEDRGLADGFSLGELATALSAHGGGALSADLALDLVLNEIVEHARLATGATAAAIALARGDEIVCRATTGANAPDLGVQLNVHSGLSGACVQSKKWQRCDDTEIDPRVDAEVCRSLGVRSILVFPVVRGDELLGVFEIFSPRPNAFSDREIQTLQALSRNIVNNVDRAVDVLAAPALPAPAVATPSSSSAKVERDDLLQFDPPPFDYAQVDPTELDPPQPEAALPVIDSSPNTNKNHSGDPWMVVLTMAVIVLALFLGWVTGYVRSPRASVGSKAKAPVNTTSPSAQPNPPESNASKPSAAMTSPAPMPVSPTPASPKTPPASSQAAGTAAPVGGLVVYDKGKVIFQTPPQSSSRPADDTAREPVTVPSKVADQYLVQRVEPEYPEPAREQHIQGPVVLEALVGKDGTVEKLSTISGDSQLASAASDAVRQWRFKPFLRNGSPEEFQTQITVSFRLP